MGLEKETEREVGSPFPHNQHCTERSIFANFFIIKFIFFENKCVSYFVCIDRLFNLEDYVNHISHL